MIYKNHHYNNLSEVIFDDYKHEYWESGVEVTSVTKALSVINKPTLVAWAANKAIEAASIMIQPGKTYDEVELATIWESARKAHYQAKTDAGTLGILVHKWVEHYIKTGGGKTGEMPPMPVNDKLKDSIDKFLKWQERHQVEFLTSEQPIFSKKYRYAGTLDFVCKLDGKLFLGDLKTSSGIYPEQFIQTAAYRQARTEEFPQENYFGQLIVRIGKDGSFEFARVVNDQTYSFMLVGFIAALKLQQTLAVLKDFRPERE
jgi:hypothetical protein